MFRKNVASQFLYFGLINATTGAALTGATVTGKRAIDGAAQASVTGTISEEAGGQYKIALSQADINGNNIGFLFTATSAIPVNISVVTTAADPTDSVRFGLTSLPNAAAGANGGLPLGDASGRVDVGKLLGTAWLTPGTAGTPDVNVKLWNGLTTVALPLVPTTAGRTLDVTAANKVNGVVLVDTVTTYTGNTPQTGDNFARVGVAGAGLTALGDTRIANLDAAVSSRSTYAGGAVASVTAGVTVTTNNDKTGYGLSAAAVQAVWDALTSALTTVGSIGKLVVTNLDAAISTRTKPADTQAAVTSVASVVGLTASNLDATISSRASSAALATVQADTDDMQTRLPAALVSGRMDSSVGAYPGNTVQTGDNYARLGAPAGASVSADVAAVAALIAALNNISSAQVKAQVVAALTTDTYAEPTGAPAATASIENKIGRLHQAIRNALTVTATTKTFKDDSGSALWSKALADNGTTFTESEGA